MLSDEEKGRLKRYRLKRYFELRAQLAKTQRMLEIALCDLRDVKACKVCVHGSKRSTEEPCRNCYGDKWQWRGEKEMRNA